MSDPPAAPLPPTIQTHAISRPRRSPAAALYGAFGRGGFDGGGMCIRRARADDIPQIQVCNRASLPENYNDSFYARHLADWGHLAFVADADREVVGYVLGRVNERHTETPAGPGSTRPTEGHITSLAVSDRFRRRGVAKQLMVAVHDEMEKLVQTSKLHVRCSNAGALQLYASLGYAVVDVVQGYYHDGEAAYLMAADLSLPVPVDDDADQYADESTRAVALGALAL